MTQKFTRAHSRVVNGLTLEEIISSSTDLKSYIFEYFEVNLYYA